MRSALSALVCRCHHYSPMSRCGVQQDGSPRGVYSPVLHECRCTAGWDGRFCQRRSLRPCNAAAHDVRRLAFGSNCAGNCDEERGICYCAGHQLPYQRFLPARCSPTIHATSRLPDGRPALPMRTARGEWVMHPSIRARGWSHPNSKPFEYVYGRLEGNPAEPSSREPLGARVSYCTANHSTPRRLVALAQCDALCPDGRRGRFCEKRKDSFCLRSCSGHGRCDMGFCWCDDGWFGIDCSLHETLAVPQQQVPRLITARSLELRVYVYDMPSEFTTRLLQYRVDNDGPHREVNPYNVHYFTATALYAAETAVHEWLLDSPLRTTDGRQAHLFFVPIYLSSLFIWPVSGYAAEPFYGLYPNESKRRLRGHQASLLMLRALKYIRTYYPYWNASGGANHVWMMLHDEGPCHCPREIRPSLLLAHYGYYADPPKRWTAYLLDDWLASPAFYSRYIGGVRHPTRCFDPNKDLTIPAWKNPSFWQFGLTQLFISQYPHRPRKHLVYFSGDLGRTRREWYSHRLRQTAYALFCDPQQHAQRLKSRQAKGCNVLQNGCRRELPTNCSRWRPGVVITEHTAVRPPIRTPPLRVTSGSAPLVLPLDCRSPPAPNGIPLPKAYSRELANSTYCLAFPGDGWSSRVVDAVVHGCVPVIFQDESMMFFEGVFDLVGAELGYPDFSIRLRESELPRLLDHLDAISPLQLRRYQRNILLVRDYFIYKDLWTVRPHIRTELVGRGAAGQDAFLMLALALEGKARQIGALRSRLTQAQWLGRNRALLTSRPAPPFRT